MHNSIRFGVITHINVVQGAHSKNQTTFANIAHAYLRFLHKAKQVFTPARTCVESCVR